MVGFANWVVKERWMRCEVTERAARAWRSPLPFQACRDEPKPQISLLLLSFRTSWLAG